MLRLLLLLLLLLARGCLTQQVLLVGWMWQPADRCALTAELLTANHSTDCHCTAPHPHPNPHTSRAWAKSHEHTPLPHHSAHRLPLC